VKLWEIGDANAAISMPLPGLLETTALVHAWAILLGLTLPAGGIRSVDGHDYRAGNVSVC
jgi:hypothetical protein